MKYCKHCWHKTKTDLTIVSQPPQDQYICCICGEHKYVRQQRESSAWTDDGPKHGPFAPKVVQVWNPGPAGKEDGE